MKNSTDLNEIPILTDKETLEQVVDCLSQHISIDTEGAFNQTDLFNILVRAASQKDSIENTASTLTKVTGGNNIRYHLSKINDFEQLETDLNLALANQIPRGIKKSHLKLAIDLNLIPYYGNPSEEELPYIYRSKAKNGTCSFYAYATLYAIKKNKRVTLAIRGVRWSDTKVALITYLLANLTNLNLKGKIQKLYLDREFFQLKKQRKLPLALIFSSRF